MIINSIKLNFLDKYYHFYEWLNDDKIQEYKNVELVKVSSKALNDLIAYQVNILNDNLNKDLYVFTDSYSYVAIKFKNKKSILKSSLLLEDEYNLKKILNKAKYIKLTYQKIELEKEDQDIRLNSLIKKYLIKEINKIKDQNDLDKIKYIYYEWFQHTESDGQKMLNKMLNYLDKPIDDKIKYIYDLFKNNYKLV